MWLDDVKTFVSSTNTLCDCCSTLKDLLAECAFPFRKGMHRRLTFFARLLQREARDVKHETEERNIQQRNIFHRSEAGLAECVDQHHFIRSNNYEHDEFQYWHGQENSWILFLVYWILGRTDCNQLTNYR